MFCRLCNRKGNQILSYSVHDFELFAGKGEISVRDFRDCIISLSLSLSLFLSFSLSFSYLSEGLADEDA